MSKFIKSTSTKRFVTEGFVIVLSILLAFAIDAWWDEWREKNAETEQLARLSKELNINAEIIQQKLETLGIAIDATSEFISWMGPEPEIVQKQMLLNTWTSLYSIGTLALTRAASQDYLAVGRINSLSNAKVRQAVAEWYSLGDDLEKHFDLLRLAHANIAEYLSDSIPQLYLDSAHPAMASHPKSKFPFDQAVLLSDPRFESRLSLYLIRLEFVSKQAKNLLEQQSNLISLIESTDQ